MDSPSNFYIEYDLNGKVINVSDDLLKLLQCVPRDLIGKNHADIVFSASVDQVANLRFWEDLRKGMTKDRMNMLRIAGRELKIFETYIPKQNNRGYVSKIITYIDVFVRKSDEKFEMLQNAEADITDKNTLKSNFLKIRDTQKDTYSKMQAMKERNRKRLQDLDDMLKQSF